MSPSADAALRTLMATLMTEIAPKLADEYLKSSVNVIAVLQMLLADEVDRAAAVRHWENGAMRGLFARACEVVADDDLARQLRSVAESADEDLRVSALSRGNGELKETLILLQTYLEADDGEPGGALQREIWRFLTAAAQRRSFSI